MTRADLSYLRPILLWAGVCALVLIAGALLFGLNLGVWFSVAMIGLAGGSILYQTQTIIRRYPEGVRRRGPALRLGDAAVLVRAAPAEPGPPLSGRGLRELPGHRRIARRRHLPAAPLPAPTRCLRATAGAPRRVCPGARDDPFPLVDGHGDPPLDPVGRDQAGASPTGWRTSRSPPSTYRTCAGPPRPRRRAPPARPRTPRGARPAGGVPGRVGGRVVPEARGRGPPRGAADVRRAAVGRHPRRRAGRGVRGSRISGAIGRIAAAHPDETVAVVCHGGVIGQALAQASRRGPSPSRLGQRRRLPPRRHRRSLGDTPPTTPPTSAWRSRRLRSRMT